MSFGFRCISLLEHPWNALADHRILDMRLTAGRLLLEIKFLG